MGSARSGLEGVTSSGLPNKQLYFSECPNKVFRLVSEIRPSYWYIIYLERSVQPDQPTSSDHLVDTEIMLQDTLFLCLVGVGQIVSFRNQQSFRSPSGIIGFDANGRITIQRAGGTIQRLGSTRKRGAQSFSVQPGEPFQCQFSPAEQKVRMLLRPGSSCNNNLIYKKLLQDSKYRDKRKLLQDNKNRQEVHRHKFKT